MRMKAVETTEDTPLTRTGNHRQHRQSSLGSRIAFALRLSTSPTLLLMTPASRPPSQPHRGNIRDLFGKRRKARCGCSGSARGAIRANRRPNDESRNLRKKIE